MKRLWLVVADGARARLFECHGPGARLQEAERLDHPPSRLREQELVSDRPGRSFDSAGQGRHAMEGGSAHHHELEVFAKRIAQRLGDARRANAFDALVLIAPPTFLGVLRAALDKQLAQCVQSSIDKDLTDADEATLRRAVYS